MLSQFTDENTAGIRLAFYIALLAAFAILETAFPRRTRSMPRSGRWIINLSISVIDSFVSRLILPAGAVGFAILSAAHGEFGDRLFY